MLETMGAHIDALKFAGGSFTLMPERALREILDTALEHVLTQGPQAVNRYIDEVARLGFDILDLFADHSQIVQLECLRRGIWGTKSFWGRVVTYPES